MYRYAIRIEYDGSQFYGWQRQRSQITVQQCLEEALGSLTGRSPTVSGAGRTDRGVHAYGQVAHFDLDRCWEAFTLNEAINAHLRPYPISLLQTVPVLSGFNSRTDAIERTYRYKILVRRAPLSLNRKRFWHVQGNFDTDRLQEGASQLIGRHDFTTFRTVDCQANSPVRTLDNITIANTFNCDGQVVEIDFIARSFLHRQVRSMVGSLAKVALGSWKTEEIGQLLEARDRTVCGPVAPADGLYLVKVTYPIDPF